MKFKTERTCWHNGRYYEEGAIVECDCKFCKEGSVKYFTKYKEPTEEKVSRETVVEEEKPKKRQKIEII